MVSPVTSKPKMVLFVHARPVVGCRQYLREKSPASTVCIVAGHCAHRATWFAGGDSVAGNSGQK